MCDKTLSVAARVKSRPRPSAHRFEPGGAAVDPSRERRQHRARLPAAWSRHARAERWPANRRRLACEQHRRSTPAGPRRRHARRLPPADPVCPAPTSTSPTFGPRKPGLPRPPSPGRRSTPAGPNVDPRPPRRSNPAGPQRRLLRRSPPADPVCPAPTSTSSTSEPGRPSTSTTNERTRARDELPARLPRLLQGLGAALGWTIAAGFSTVRYI